MMTQFGLLRGSRQLSHRIDMALRVRPFYRQRSRCCLARQCWKANECWDELTAAVRLGNMRPLDDSNDSRKYSAPGAGALVFVVQLVVRGAGLQRY